METVSFAVSNRIYLLMQSHAAEHGLKLSALVELALEDFLDIIERCDPEARAVARALSLTDE